MERNTLKKSDINYSFGTIMSEVFTRYLPYHDIPYNKDLATYAKPQNRPTTEELANTLGQFLNPEDEDGNYRMVMESAKQGSLKKLLDSKYSELDWASKVATLYYIADGLNTIHEVQRFLFQQYS
ncbi:kinase-like protein [Gigaspora margarita]|uniref:Kinase-like protein n=1 Tax=Gigaspora margarita TaxID=4874 RepID=A0A8H3XI83_GIGMA|nr:kinase-like protein [Gigaspora margarita]